MLGLDGGRSYVMLALCGALLHSRLPLNAAGAAIVSHVRIVHDGVLANDGLVDVCVGNDGCIHVHDCGVIRECSALPLAAGEADAHVAKAIIHTAVEADGRAPVSGMEQVLTA
jgi:hypothetical protein